MSRRNFLICLAAGAAIAAATVILLEKAVRDAEDRSAGLKQEPDVQRIMLTPAPARGEDELVPVADFELNRKTGEKQFLR